MDAGGPAVPRPSAPTLLLVGNPNVGKSVLFSKLTGKFVVVSNYPGTTVELTRGQATLDGQAWDAIDTPGVNELAARTEDARVTCDVVGDYPHATIVQVADAKNLRRALLLTLQLAERQRPMVLVLNMMDELDKCGGKIDVRKLSELLGIPVIPTIAVAGTGVHLLQKNIAAAAVPRLGVVDLPGLPRGTGVPPMRGTHGQDDRATGARPAEAPAQSAAGDYDRTATHLARVNDILGQVYTLTRPRRPSFAQRLGWWAVHPWKGLALVALVLYLMFWFVGLLGSGTAVDFLETFVFGRYVSPWAIRAADTVLPFPHQHEVQDSEYSLELPLTPTHGVSVWRNTRPVIGPAYHLTAGFTLPWWQELLRFLHDFLVGEYGVITMALSYSLAIVLPIVTTFFLVFSTLEDSGYLARLAVMLNRVFRTMGLNGKAVLPVILGLGCDTMATMTTRILETRKERLITTLLLALAVPCSAQLGVLMAMMASISFGAAACWVVLMVAITLATGWGAARVLGGEAGDFILELPPMRRPQFGNVAAKTVARLEWYLREVIPLFVLGTAMLFLLDRVQVLGWIARQMEPLVTGWLGLPRDAAVAFLVGFLRRDYGAVFLLDASTGAHPLLTPHQILVAMVTITLFMPCIATLFMIARELGRQAAVLIALFVFPFAFFVGGLVNIFGKWLGR